MQRLGYLAVTGAAVLWAIGGAYASRLIHQGASLVELTEARAWIAALVLAALLWRSKRDRPTGRVGLPITILFGCSIAGANFMYYLSLSRLPVAVAITIQYTAPGLVVLWTALVARRAPSRRVVAAVATAVIGVALLAELPVVVSSGGLRLDMVGLFASLAAAVAFATYMISGEQIGRALGAQRAVLRGFLVASVLWFVVQLFRGRPDTLLNTRFVPGYVFLALATTVAPFLLFVWGLEHVPATNAGITSTLEPLTAAVIAFVWLGQRLSGWQLAGGLLVLGGIGIVQIERPAPREVLAERAAIE